jgi:hypothetical protein
MKQIGQLVVVLSQPRMQRLMQDIGGRNVLPIVNIAAFFNNCSELLTRPKCRRRPKLATQEFG